MQILGSRVHIEGKPDTILEWARECKQSVTELDAAIKEMGNAKGMISVLRAVCAAPVAFRQVEYPKEFSLCVQDWIVWTVSCI